MIDRATNAGGLRLSLPTGADVTEISSWRYEPPYDTYDVSPDDAASMTNPAVGTMVVRRNRELIGYVCRGDEARVKLLDAELGTEDLGWGLRPDLVGQRLSRELLPWVIEELDYPLDCKGLRVVILDWNARSLAAARRLGFQQTGEHVNDDGTYLLLTRRCAR